MQLTKNGIPQFVVAIQYSGSSAKAIKEGFRFLEVWFLLFLLAGFELVKYREKHDFTEDKRGADISRSGGKEKNHSPYFLTAEYLLPMGRMVD